MAMLATIDPLREKDRARYRGYDAKVVLGRIAWQAELAPHASAEIRVEDGSLNSTRTTSQATCPSGLLPVAENRPTVQQVRYNTLRPSFSMVNRWQGDKVCIFAVHKPALPLQ